jgi:hypothetical protein
MTTGSHVFPTRLFGPSSLQARLVGQAITGGVSLSGEAQFADASGGGRWVVDFGETALWTKEKVLAWRRLAAMLDGGAASVIVPFADRRHQPVNPKYTGSDTFGTTTWVADRDAWTAEEVTAVTTADAALGATSLAFNLTAPLALLGGEKLAILHSTMSWRIYEIGRVKTGGTVGSAVATTVDIRPPLRQAVASASALNFTSPRCVMRVEGDMSETLGQLKFGKASARFVEYPGAP